MKYTTIIIAIAALLQACSTTSNRQATKAAPYDASIAIAKSQEAKQHQLIERQLNEFRANKNLQSEILSALKAKNTKLAEQLILKNLTAFTRVHFTRGEKPIFGSFSGCAIVVLDHGPGRPKTYYNCCYYFEPDGSLN